MATEREALENPLFARFLCNSVVISSMVILFSWTGLNAGICSVVGS